MQMSAIKMVQVLSASMIIIGCISLLAVYVPSILVGILLVTAVFTGYLLIFGFIFDTDGSRSEEDRKVVDYPSFPQMGKSEVIQAKRFAANYQHQPGFQMTSKAQDD